MVFQVGLGKGRSDARDVCVGRARSVNSQADIKDICQSAQVDALPEDRATALRGCVGDETSARDQLRREWGRYSAADKGNCASTPGMQFRSPSAQEFTCSLAAYCCGQPASKSPSASCAAFMSPTRSGGGDPAACICTWHKVSTTFYLAIEDV